MALRIISAVLISSAFLLVTGRCRCEEERFSSAGQAGIYEYDEFDPPDVFFFPTEKAKWDGPRVTVKEWYTLTKLQKEKFISEYVGELKKQYSDAIEIMGIDYLKALNLFSYYSDNNVLNEPSAKFIDRLLIGQGKIKTKVPH